MNDETFFEPARFVGQRMVKEGRSEVLSRLRHDFRLVAGRTTSPAEAKVLRDNFQRAKLARFSRTAKRYPTRP